MLWTSQQKGDYKEVEPINFNCHTDGSKLDDNRTEAGVLINYSHNDIAKEAIYLGNNATVFQAEVFPVGRTASHLIFAETKTRVLSSIAIVRPQLWLLTTLKLSPKLP